MVIFFSDNGGCAEVIAPQWYDVPSRTRDGRSIQVGNTSRNFAGPETVWQSYGLAWANVSDTPFRQYKHFKAWAKRCNVVPFDQLLHERPIQPAGAPAQKTTTLK